MLYEDILKGCKDYHNKYGTRYDSAYRSYRRFRNTGKWDNPDTLNYTEVERLVAFLKRWDRFFPSAEEDVKNLLNKLKGEVPYLNLL